MELVDVEKPIYVMKTLYCKIEDCEDSIRERLFEELKDFYENMNGVVDVALSWNDNSSPLLLEMGNPFFCVRHSLEHVLLQLIEPEQLEEIEKLSDNSKLIFTFNGVKEDNERISLRGFTIDYGNRINKEHRQYIGYIGFNDPNAEVSLYDFVNYIVGLYIPLRILRDVLGIHEITEEIIYDKVTLMTEQQTCFISLQEHQHLPNTSFYLN